MDKNKVVVIVSGGICDGIYASPQLAQSVEFEIVDCDNLRDENDLERTRLIVEKKTEGLTYVA